jgi:hypothetical protein
MADHLRITLNELHCEAQSEAGGCEPYLFTSFFTVGADGEVQVTSPSHHDIRGAFADDVEAGQTLPVPQEIGSAELPASGQAGIVALVIDEDMSRDVAVEKAHQAFHAEVEAQLRAGNGSLDEEQLRSAVLSKVRSAVGSTYDYQDIHRDQDDHLGVGVHRIQGPGAFELPLGFAEDRFILRGEVR